MPVLEQQDAVGIEPAEAVVVRVDALGAVPVSERETVPEQRHGCDAAHVVGKRQQQDIQLAVHEPLIDALRLVLVQVEFQLRMLAPQLRQCRREEKRRDRRYHAEVQFARQGLALAAGHLHQALDVPQAKPCLRRELLAHGGNRHAAVGAVDELHLQQRFQLLDRIAESRLGHETGLGRAAEMLRLGQRDEITQLLDCR